MQYFSYWTRNPHNYEFVRQPYFMLYAALFAFGAQRGVIALPFYVTASLLAVSVVLASTIQYESSKSTDN